MSLSYKSQITKGKVIHKGVLYLMAPKKIEEEMCNNISLSASFDWRLVQ